MGKKGHKPDELENDPLFQEIQREKQAARDRDQQDVASGRRSVEEVNRRNNLFYGLRLRVDLKSAKRLW
ncbi:MAG: hypothetical protein QM767_11440 [Anaeromyxobacter sp.]